MALADLSLDAANNIQRQGEAFVTNDPIDGSETYHHMGQVKNVEFTSTPVTSEQDTAGRQKQLASDIEITFVMQQTSDTELETMDELVSDFAAVFLSTEFIDASEVQTGSDGNGYLFSNGLMSVENTINFSGEESMSTVTISGRVSREELASMGTDRTLRFGV